MILKEALEIVFNTKSETANNNRFNDIFGHYKFPKKFLKSCDFDDTVYDLTDEDVEFIKFVVNIYNLDPGKRENASAKNFDITNYRKIVDFIRNCIENNTYPLIQDYLKESVSSEEFFSLDLLQKLSDKITKVLAFACENNYADYKIYTQLSEYLDMLLYTYAGHKTFLENFRNANGYRISESIHLDTDNKNTITSYVNSDGSINNIGLYQGVSIYLNKLYKEISGHPKRRIVNNSNYNMDILPITYSFFDVETLSNFIYERIEQKETLDSIFLYIPSDENSINKNIHFDINLTSKINKHAYTVCNKIMCYADELTNYNHTRETDNLRKKIKDEMEFLYKKVVLFCNYMDLKQLKEISEKSESLLLSFDSNILQFLSQESIMCFN